MKAISNKLGLIPVSMYELLVDQIRSKTEVGQQIYPDLTQNRLISNEVVSGILKARLNKADCKLHGVVLEGFPKSDSQAKVLHEMHFEPDFVVYLDCSEAVAKSRLLAKAKESGREGDERIISERYAIFE